MQNFVYFAFLLLMIFSVNGAVNPCVSNFDCRFDEICRNGFCIRLRALEENIELFSDQAIGCGTSGIPNENEEYPNSCLNINLYNRVTRESNLYGINLFDVAARFAYDYLQGYCFVENQDCSKVTAKKINIDTSSYKLYEPENFARSFNIRPVSNPLYFIMDANYFVPLRVAEGSYNVKFLLSCKNNQKINVTVAVDDDLMGIDRDLSNYSLKRYTQMENRRMSFEYNLSHEIENSAFGPWVLREFNFTTKIQDIALIFFQNPNCRISFLMINQSFPQYSEVENYPIYNNRSNKLLKFFEQPYYQGICRWDQCWNGFGCVNNGTLLYSNKGIYNVTRCINGEYLPLRISFNRNYTKIEYCVNDGCINKNGVCVPEFTWEDGLICLDGQWISDVDFGARFLLETYGSENVTLICRKGFDLNYKAFFEVTNFAQLNNFASISGYCLYAGKIYKRDKDLFSKVNALILFLNNSRFEFGSQSISSFFSAINYTFRAINFTTDFFGPANLYSRITNDTFYYKLGVSFYVYVFNRSRMIMLTNSNISKENLRPSYDSFRRTHFESIDKDALVEFSLYPRPYYFEDIEFSPELIFFKNFENSKIILIAINKLLLYDEYNYRIRMILPSYSTNPYKYIFYSSEEPRFLSQIIKVMKESDNVYLFETPITIEQLLRYVSGHDTLE